MEIYPTHYQNELDWGVVWTWQGESIGRCIDAQKMVFFWRHPLEYDEALFLRNQNKMADFEKKMTALIRMRMKDFRAILRDLKAVENMVNKQTRQRKLKQD